MSGFHLSFSGDNNSENIAQALSFTPKTQNRIIKLKKTRLIVTRVDSMDLWGPAHDDQTGVGVALGGRVAFEAEDWMRANGLPFDGGRACKLILERWLDNASRIEECLNGAFCVIINDPRQQKLHLITDRMGIYPVYCSRNEPFVACTHPDVLAAALRRQGRPVALDFSTVAEFIGTGSSVHPYTYYQEICQLAPSTHHTFSFLGENTVLDAREYWKPQYLIEEPSRDSEPLVGHLADAFKKAVRRRTHPALGKAGLFLSGGFDSRTILFAAEDPSRIETITFYDEPNDELKTARRLAKCAGAKHHALKRKFEYYGEQAEEVVRISGGIWSIMDAHHYGFRKEVDALGMDTVLTGCYADYMLKGLAFNRRRKTLFGRELPLYSFSDFDFSFYMPHVALSRTWQKRVLERLEERFPYEIRSRYQANLLRVEDLRLRPLSREADVSGRLTLWRAFGWDHLLSDKDILDVYGRIAPELKLNGVLFGRAVGSVTGKSARKIADNNYGAPVDASEFQRAVYYVFRVLKYKYHKMTMRILGYKESPMATSGSWPNWSYFISHSQSISRLWSNPSQREIDVFTDLLGYNPWSISIESWSAKDALFFMRLLTARIWLKNIALLG